MSLATCRRRIGSGIASPRASGNPRPSQRAKTYSSAAWMLEPRSSHPANRCATSHIVANDVTSPRAGVGDGVLDHRGADLRGAAGPDVGPVERQDLRGVGRVDQEERGSVRDVVAEQLRRLVPVRRAPGGVEERDVVRVRELLRRCSGELAEPDREHGGAQRVLERLPGAEVGREREGTDHLGGADRLLMLREPPRARRDPMRPAGTDPKMRRASIRSSSNLQRRRHRVLRRLRPRALGPVKLGEALLHGVRVRESCLCPALHECTDGGEERIPEGFGVEGAHMGVVESSSRRRRKVVVATRLRRG